MRKLQLTTILIIFSFWFSSCTKETKLSGRIEGLGNDNLIVHYISINDFYSGEEATKDTIYSTEGNFEYSPKINELTIFWISPVKLAYKRKNGSLFMPHKLTVFLAKNDQIKIEGKIGKNNMLDYKAFGSELNEIDAELNHSFLKENEELLLLNLAINNSDNNEERKLLFEKRRKIFGKIREKQNEYIKANPNKAYSGFLVGRYVDLQQFEEYYNLLSPAIQQGDFKAMLDEKKAICDADKKIKVGGKAPYFELKTIEDKDFTLDKITDKEYIILDFWGSWCGACVKGFPKMKEYYKKYKDKIEVVGINCNDSDEDWKAATKENQLPWLQVREKKEDKVAISYSVKGYPTKFILDNKHKIIAIFEGEGDNFYEELDRLLETEGGKK